MKKTLVVFLIVLMLATGCAKNDENTNDSAEPKITFESYEKVSVGMSYKKVCEILGGESTVDAESFAFPDGMSNSEKSEFAGASFYVWREVDYRGKIIGTDSISVAILNGMVVAKNFRGDEDLHIMENPISLESFRDLRFGKSYSSVAEIVGDPMVSNYHYTDANQNVVGYSHGLWPDWELEFEFANNKLTYKYIAFHLSEDYSKYEITEDILLSIESGMSYDEVCAITRSEGCFMYEAENQYELKQAFVWWYEAQTILYFVDGYLYEYEYGGGTGTE